MNKPKFDPNKPFDTSKEKPTFDPNQPHHVDIPTIPSDDPVSKIESLLRGIGQGASFGFADEATAGLESLLSSKSYEDALAESRKAYKAAEEENPMTSFAGNILGGLAVPVPGAALATGGLKTASTGARILKATLPGAAVGAIGGLGTSEATDSADLAKDVATGAAGGAVISGAFSGLGKLAGAAKNKWLQSDLSGELIDAAKMKIEDPTMFTKEGRVATGRALDEAVSGDLRKVSVDNVKSNINKIYEQEKRRAEAEGRRLDFAQFRDKMMEHIDNRITKDKEYTAGRDELVSYLDSLGEVTREKIPGVFTADAEEAARNEVLGQLNKQSLSNESLFINEARKNAQKEAEKIHSNNVTGIKSTIKELEKAFVKADKDATKLEEKAKKISFVNPSSVEAANQNEIQKQAVAARKQADAYTRMIQQAEMDIQFVPEPKINLEEVDAKSREILDEARKKYSPKLERSQDDITGDVVFKASAEGAGEVPTQMFSTKRVKIPSTEKEIVGRSEITPEQADEALRRIDSRLSGIDPSSTEGQGLIKIKGELKNLLYGKDIKALATDVVEGAAPKEITPGISQGPMALRMDKQQEIKTLADRMRAAGMETTQDTLDTLHSKSKYVNSILGIPEGFFSSGGQVKQEMLDGIKDKVRKIMLKASRDPASPEARELENLDKVMKELSDKGVADYKQFSDVFNETKKLARKEYLMNSARERGMPSDAGLLKQIVSPSISGRAKLIEYAATGAGAINSVITAAEKTGIPQMTTKLVKMPVAGLTSLAESLETKNSKFAPMIRKVINEPEQKRKALMFTLMQQPAFREAIKEFTPGDGEQ